MEGVKLIKDNISVIVPTLNGEKDLENLLSLLLNQDCHIREIIIVDSHSSDKTLDIAKKYDAKIISINQEDFDHGGTRNLGASKATGDILVFMTQDALPETERTIGQLIEPLKNNDVIVSYARQIPKPDCHVTDKFLRLYNYPPKSIVKSKDLISKLGLSVFQNSNVCAAYRRNKFFELGGFPEKIISNEDMTFAAMAVLAGYKVMYNAEARVYHSHNYSLFTVLKRYFDIGASLKQEKWVLKYAMPDVKGFDFTVKQFKYLVAENCYLLIPKAFLEVLFKYIGYKLGYHHNILPRIVKRNISLCKNFWNKQKLNLNNLNETGGKYESSHNWR